ncbi:MAG: carboxypeptidase regulatory-like domain-containing protein [Elusimicrobiota bacterium]
MLLIPLSASAQEIPEVNITTPCLTNTKFYQEIVCDGLFPRNLGGKTFSRTFSIPFETVWQKTIQCFSEYSKDLELLKNERLIITRNLNIQQNRLAQLYSTYSGGRSYTEKDRADYFVGNGPLNFFVYTKLTSIDEHNTTITMGSTFENSYDEMFSVNYGTYSTLKRTNKQEWEIKASQKGEIENELLDCIENKLLLTDKSTGTIQGIVRDKDTGLPINGAVVEVFTDNVLKYVSTTDHQGNFFTNIKTGKYLIFVSFIGYISELTKNVDISENQTKSLTIQLEHGDSSLVGYWKFEEGNGDIAFDYSGYRNHGIIYGNPKWVTTVRRANTALYFDGIDDYIEIPASQSLMYPGTGGWTIDCRIKCDTDKYPADTCILSQLSIGYSACDPYNFRINDDSLCFRIDNNTGQTINLETNSKIDKNWHRLTGIYDNNTSSTSVQLYLDYKLSASELTNVSMGSRMDAVFIGGTAPVDLNDNNVRSHVDIVLNNFKGLIDEAQIYNRVIIPERKARVTTK